MSEVYTQSPLLASTGRASRYVSRTCLLCGKPFETLPGLVKIGKGKYCSQSCANRHIGMRHGTLEERFWRRVNKSANSTGCWEWTGPINAGGYGHVTVARKPVRAHRFSWTLHYGPIPEGMLVCHRCDNPKCVNPDHLFLGTQQDNVADKVRKGRQTAGDRIWTAAHPERMKRGEEHPKTNLTTEQVLDIRARAAAGEYKPTAMGAEYGVDPTTIYNIVRRKTWKHLP